MNDLVSEHFMSLSMDAVRVTRNVSPAAGTVISGSKSVDVPYGPKSHMYARQEFPVGMVSPSQNPKISVRLSKRIILRQLSTVIV